MTREELIKKLSSDYSLSEIEVAVYIEGLFETLANAFSKGKNINIPEFGKFRLQSKTIPPGEKTTVVHFSPVRRFSDEVNYNFNDLSPVIIRTLDEKEMLQRIVLKDIEPIEDTYNEEILLLDADEETFDYAKTSELIKKMEELVASEQPPKIRHDEQTVFIQPEKEITEETTHEENIITVPEIKDDTETVSEIPEKETEQKIDKEIIEQKPELPVIPPSSPVFVGQDLMEEEFRKAILKEDDLSFADDIKKVMDEREKSLDKLRELEEKEFNDIAFVKPEEKIIEPDKLHIDESVIPKTPLEERTLEELIKSLEDIQPTVAGGKTEEITEKPDELKKESTLEDLIKSLEDTHPPTDLEKKEEIAEKLKKESTLEELIKSLEDTLPPVDKEKTEEITEKPDEQKPKPEVAGETHHEEDIISHIESKPQTVFKNIEPDIFANLESELTGISSTQSLDDLSSLIDGIDSPVKQTVFDTGKETEKKIENLEMKIFDKLIEETEPKTEIKMPERLEEVFISKTSDEPETRKPFITGENEVIRSYDDVFKTLEIPPLKPSEKKEEITEEKTGKSVRKIILILLFFVVFVIVVMFLYNLLVNKEPDAQQTPPLLKIDSTAIKDSLEKQENNSEQVASGEEVAYKDKEYSVIKNENGYYVQVGAYDKPMLADLKMKLLKDKNLEAFVEKTQMKKIPIYRVKVGPYETLREAKSIFPKLSIK